MVLKSLQDTHSKWSAHDADRRGNRLAGRYEMMDAYDSWHLTHLPGYLEALEEFSQKGGLKLLEALGDYKFAGGHGHLCLAGTKNWQPLHSDFVMPNWRELAPMWDVPKHVAFMDLLFTLHPLTSTNAALRVIPGHPPTETTYQQIPQVDRDPRKCPQLNLETEPDIFKRARIYPLPAGCGLLRDLRIWHGGTPNTSEEDRYTAVLRFYSSFYLDLVKGSEYEGKGVEPEEFQRKLSKEAQKSVWEHIILGEGDEKPKIEPYAGWQSAKAGWGDVPEIEN